MRRRHSLAVAVLFVMLAAALPASGQAPPLVIEDMPLAQYGGVARGGTVTPAYEGWYRLPTGEFILYFGYYNRNTEEVVEIPVGAENSVEGPWVGFDRAQPTTFQPGRAWGVFGVKVPADFGDKTVLWTLSVNGGTTAIPGRLRPEWMVPGLDGDVMGNHPPTIRFSENGPTGEGPAGVRADVQHAVAGSPVQVSVWASDDRPNATRSAPVAPVTLTWSKHRGAGEVTFESRTGTVPETGGSMTTAITFGQPGTYVLRVTAIDDLGITEAGNEQCCWTNGYVEFEVGR